MRSIAEPYRYDFLCSLEACLWLVTSCLCVTGVLSVRVSIRVCICAFPSVCMCLSVCMHLPSLFVVRHCSSSACMITNPRHVTKFLFVCQNRSSARNETWSIFCALCLHSARILIYDYWGVREMHVFIRVLHDYEALLVTVVCACAQSNNFLCVSCRLARTYS